MQPWTVRTFVRATVAAVLAGLGALGTAVIDESIATAEWVAIATATISVFAAWLGIGAAPGPGDYTEPFLNSDKTSETVEVPSPPAVDSSQP